jgi:serine/threonine protein kinase
VLEAFDRREHRRVALKLPNGGLAEDAAFLERLEREARTAAGLVHPNVAAVHGMGRDARTGFVVAELVAGCSLEDMLIDRGLLPAAGAARIAIDVCAALEAAHARGLDHGHLPPSNILLAIDGSVKVTDFRLAQAARRPDTVPAPADDLAALGRCLATMLTGREPAVGAPTTTVATAAPLPTARQSTTTGQRIGAGQRIVPAVVGLHRQQVTDVLAQAQLAVQMIPVQVSDSRQVQRVVAQRPSAGEILPAGSAVTVLIGSRKPTAAPT